MLFLLAGRISDGKVLRLRRYLPCGIASGWLIGRMQRVEERNQGVDLGSIQILAVGRHVAATLHDLAHKLSVGFADGHTVQRRPAKSARTANGMTVTALLFLEDGRALCARAASGRSGIAPAQGLRSRHS